MTNPHGARFVDAMKLYFMDVEPHVTMLFQVLVSLELMV